MVEQDNNAQKNSGVVAKPQEEGASIQNDIRENQTEKKTVVVEEKVLKDILSKVEGLETERDSMRATITMLESVADKSRVATFLAKNSRGELIRTASAWKWKGKFVVATVTEKNESYVDMYGRQVVDQILKVVFDDSTETEYSYANFMKERELVSGEVIKRASEESGDFWTLKFPDGKQMTFNLLFLN